jgi:hypothetical protein
MIRRRRANPNNQNTNDQTLVTEFKRLCKPRIAKLFNLLEVDNKTGERCPVTFKILQTDVLPMCVTKYDIRLMKRWISELEIEAKGEGLETKPIPRKTFFNRVHKDMFAPLLIGIVEVSKISKLKSTFEDVICSVERNRRWSKLKDRFTMKDISSLSNINKNNTNNQNDINNNQPSRSSNTSSNIFEKSIDKGKGSQERSTNKRKSLTHFKSSENNRARNQHHHQHPDHYFNLNWDDHRRHRGESTLNLHKNAQHLMSTVRVWSYDSITKRAKTVTSHSGDHVSRVSIQKDKLVVLLSNGKMEESSIHLTLLSKIKSTEIKSVNGRPSKSLRRYNSLLTEDTIHESKYDDDKDDVRVTNVPKRRDLQRSTSSSNVMDHNHKPLPLSSSHSFHNNDDDDDDDDSETTIDLSKYPERTGLGISCRDLFAYDVVDISTSDTQAAMLVNGQLYTWGCNPNILGHPTLPKQNSSMKTPEIEDVIDGSTVREDYLQKEKYDNCYKSFINYHMDMCESAGLMKDGFDSTWLEYPKDADELWKNLQQKWYIKLVSSEKCQFFIFFVRLKCFFVQSITFLFFSSFFTMSIE